MFAQLTFLVELEEDSEVAEFGERMRVLVKERVGDQYVGWLTNTPFFWEAGEEEYLVRWCEVPFEPRHVIDVHGEHHFAARSHLVPDRPSRVWR